jgi:hypothetical protein
MVSSVSVEVTQADTSVVYSAEAANVFTTQTDVQVVFNFPSSETQASQADINFVSLNTSDVDVSQVLVDAIIIGRSENPLLRAWVFTLDNHEFYVLRLGDELTLVYDTYSEQWVDWRSPGLSFWRANCGINWIGGEAFAAIYGSNIVVGDDTYGLLWFLGPETPYDESPQNNVETRYYFERVVMGQMTVKGREVMPCFAAWLTTDAGAPAYDGAGVRLLISDDAGKTFSDCGLVTVTEGDFSPQLSWYSLGQISAPGRLFKIEDDGAVTRIDGLEMNDPDNGG